MLIFRNEFLNCIDNIKNMNKIKSENLSDNAYYKYWCDLNCEYKYLLINLKRYLSSYENLNYTEFGLPTKNYHDLLTFVDKCLFIGDNFNYYNNKYSRQLINIDYSYYMFNQKNYIKDSLNFNL